MPNTLTGAPAAAAIYAQVRARAALLDAPPCLAAVSVGAQPDDLAYLRSIAQAAAGCGIAVRFRPEDGAAVRAALAASTLRPDEYAFYGVTGSGAALRAEPLDG